MDSDDMALWERVMLVPFQMRFVDDPSGPNEKQRNKDLPGLLREEASGVLAWLVRGLHEWREQGLNPPDAVRAATREYRESEDVLKAFFDDRCVISPEAWVRAGALYDSYKDWAAGTGHRVMSGTRFWKRAQERFEKQHRDTGNVYLGIGLLQVQG